MSGTQTTKGAKAKLALILHSGTYDRLHQAMSIVQAGVANDMEVHVLFTYHALESLIQGKMDTAELERSGSRLAESFTENIREGKVETPTQMLKRAKALGDVHVYACSLSMALINVKKEDLGEEVEKPMGYVSFLNIAEGAAVTLYI
ncbi:MAG: DsrE/DsrF/DrsH-like family protein [Candidatus Bathyarchaeia archaeon]